jgi:hypothetical protein
MKHMHRFLTVRSTGSPLQLSVPNLIATVSGEAELLAQKAPLGPARGRLERLAAF